MWYFDRNRNENSNGESGNENGLCNGCSDRGLYGLFRIVSEEDFQKENINKIYQPEYLINIPNSLRGKQNLSSRFMHNFYLNRKEIEFDNNPKQILTTKKI